MPGVSKNPLKKLVDTADQLAKLSREVVKAAQDPDTAQLATSLAMELESSVSSKSRYPKEVRDLLKLLQQYPSLSGEVLSYARGLIKSLKKFGAELQVEKTNADVMIKS